MTIALSIYLLVVGAFIALSVIKSWPHTGTLDRIFGTAIALNHILPAIILLNV